MSRGKRGIKNLMKAAVVSVVALAAVIMAGREQMDVQAAGRPVEIRSCLISGDDVLCMIKANSVPSSDDGKYYIYADEVFEDGPEGEVVATVDAESSVTASFPLNYNTEDSNLSRKFLVAVKRNGQMMQVSDEHYITNPEEVAAFT